MAEKKPLTALTDPDNMLFVEVQPEEPEAMTVEDAYRLLAGMPPAPVEVEEAQ